MQIVPLQSTKPINNVILITHNNMTGGSQVVIPCIIVTSLISVNTFSSGDHAPPAVNIKLSVAQIISQPGRKRKEVDKNWCPQSQAIEVLPYPQATQVLQASRVSCQPKKSVKSVPADEVYTVAGNKEKAVHTLNEADFWPLFLLLQGVLKFGAEGDVVGVVKHDAHHLGR